MRNAFTIAALLLALASLTGCDFFRKVAGRPTSEEIRIKAEALAREENERAVQAAEAREQIRLDSLARLAYTADSLAAAESLKHEKVMTSRSSGGLKEGAVCRKYHIIVGSFSNPTNAAKLGKEISDKGFSVDLIPFRNGYTAVGLCGTDDIVVFGRSLAEVRRQDFCPKGYWILANE